MSIQNFYQCPTCKQEWESTWHGVVGEECHNCGEKSVLPARSKNLEESMESKKEFFSARANKGGAWCVDSYRTDSAGELRRETLIDGISQRAASKITACGNAFVEAIREARLELKKG